VLTEKSELNLSVYVCNFILFSSVREGVLKTLCSNYRNLVP
jgi:hypothetical protein